MLEIFLLVHGQRAEKSEWRLTSPKVNKSCSLEKLKRPKAYSYEKNLQRKYSDVVFIMVNLK